MANKALRWIGYALGALLALALLAAAAIWLLSSRALASRVEPAASSLAPPTAAQLADGPRMLRVSGCISCHGEGLRGELFFDIPNVAKLYAPNIALLAATMDDAALDRAIRQGIGHDGRSLFVMPSQEYQYMTDAEVAAMIAAIRALPPGGTQQPAMEVGPLGRIGIVTGKLRSAPDAVSAYRAAPLPSFGSATERGRHLVQVNCTECHGADLKGREIQPGVVSADLAIAGAYDAPQFAKMLRTGIAPGNKKLGLMGEVARDDFNYMTDEEIAAVHAYLVERAQRAP